MELIALSGIALLTAILVSRAVGTAAIQWAVTEAYSGTKYEDKTEEVLKDLDQFFILRLRSVLNWSCWIN